MPRKFITATMQFARILNWKASQVLKAHRPSGHELRNSELWDLSPVTLNVVAVQSGWRGVRRLALWQRMANVVQIHLYYQAPDLDWH
jgi:hypothetical protein